MVKSNDVNNSILYFLQVGVTSLLPLITIPVITHKLSPDDYGVFALTQVYAVIASGIANWGVIIGYERNYFLYEHDADKSGALLTTAVIFVSVNILALIMIVFCFRQSLSNYIFEQPMYDSLLMIVLIGTCLSTLPNYFLTYLKNSGYAIDYIMITLLQSIVNFSLILFFILYLDAGVYSLAYALLLSNSLLCVVVGIKQFRALPISFDKEMLIDVLKISLPLTPRIFFGVLNTQFDKIMLGMVVSVGGVGVYSIGQRVSYGVFQFMTALDRVFKPEVYRRLFSQDKSENDIEIGTYLIPFVYFSVSIALLVAVFTEELFVFIFSDSYSNAVPVVIILTVYFASLFFGKITATQLIYAKKTYLITILTLIGIVLNISLNILLILKWGIIGAACATMIAGIIMNILNYHVAQRYAPIRWIWKPVLWIYGIFSIAAIFSIIINLDLLLMSKVLTSIVKLGFIIAYLFLGAKLRIVTMSNMRNIYINIVDIMNNRMQVH